MTINACKKGKRIELLVANWLKDNGCPSAHRTQQHNGAEGTSDVTAIVELPDWHIEVKGIQGASIPRSTLKNWSEQLKRDCPENLYPVLFHKANDKELVVILPAKSWAKLATPELVKTLRWTVAKEISVNPSEIFETFNKTENVYKLLNIGSNYTRPIIAYLSSDKDLLIFIEASFWLELVKEKINGSIPQETKISDS